MTSIGLNKPATYRGAYVLISNRVDASEQVLQVYVKRWRIEVFFRTAEQNLNLAECHSTTEEHHHAHLELLFLADTLLGYAHWETNKEKTSDGDGCTHGEMVSCLFHTRCQIRSKSRNGIQTISLDIATEAIRTFCKAYSTVVARRDPNVLGRDNYFPPSTCKCITHVRIRDCPGFMIFL